MSYYSNFNIMSNAMSDGSENIMHKDFTDIFHFFFTGHHTIAKKESFDRFFMLKKDSTGVFLHIHFCMLSNS